MILKKQLTDVCLIAADTYNYGKAVDSLQKSMKQCDFGRVIFFTNIPLKIDGIDVIQIEELKGKDGYSHFILKEAYKYISHDFVLVTQHDAWVLNGSRFDERLYDVDYAGALWPEQDGLSNGNGGFSWRSYTLMENVGKDDFIKATAPEDVSLCRVYRRYLEKTYNLIWASDEICERFAFELKEPNQITFGFHNFFHQPFKETVVITRSAAIGDCIALEPVLRYYANKGFNVVVDIPIQFYPLYSSHYFPVKHISQFDKGRVPARYINLDMAYEVKPNQNYLKSYFEFCGIEDYVLSRPQLFPLVNENTKPFKKYCVVHIDQRETPHRNIYGVEWKRVQWHLEGFGYTVIQVGSNNHEECGIHLNTKDNIGSLKFFIAGCDLFLGIDSSPAGIAMAYNKPCILMFGSVNPKYIHPDLTNTVVIQQPCDKAGCWHIVGGTAGQPCVYDEAKPPCCISSTSEIINAINSLHR